MAVTILGISLFGKSDQARAKDQTSAWPTSPMKAGAIYRKVEVRPGHWEWAEDTEAMKQMAHEEQHRRELFWALRTRVLTSEEMKEVERYGQYLNVEPNTPYFAKDKAEELNSALLQQFKLRLAEQDCGRVKDH